jgi:hypothetical protein
MKKSLVEKIVGSEKMEKLTDSSAYKYAVDTAAMVSFSTPIAMANEVFVADMDVTDSLKARGIATIVNAFTARPYGKYRDFIFKKLKTTKESGFWKKYFTDVLAFATFQAPLYAGILAVSGADPEGVLAGSATITALSGFIGRPYGAYLDVLRKGCGLKPSYDLDENEAERNIE